MSCSVCGKPLFRVPGARGRPKSRCEAPECTRQYNNDRMKKYNESVRERDGKSLWQQARPALERVACRGGCGTSVGRGKEWCRPCSYREGPIHEGIVKRALAAKAARKQLVRYDAAFAEQQRQPRLFRAGWCAHCGTALVTIDGNSWRFCSRQCQQKTKKHRRRARQAGAKITPGRLAEVMTQRVCGICGDPVDTHLTEGPARPTVDHIVPLAAGGSHELSNWQLAHSLCNSIKRDQIRFALPGYPGAL